MKKFNTLFFILFCISNLSAQIDCGNGTNDSSSEVTASFNSASASDTYIVDFTSTGALTETSGGITLWLMIPSSVGSAPTVTSVSGDVTLNEVYTSNEFGDGNYYYYLTTPSQINPSSLWSEATTRSIATVTFDTAINSGDLSLVLTSPIGQDAFDFGGGTYLYYRTALTVCNGDEDSYITSQANILPITLSTFTARAINNKDAHLKWTTESEINGSHFELERSMDGVNFDKIATLAATGSADLGADYTYTDADVNDHTRDDVVRYYRLKMVDLDGEFKYSGIRNVNFTRELIDFNMEIYPNPTVDQVQIEMTGIDNTTTERPMLQIYDNTGALIQSRELDSDLGKIDMRDLPSKMYHFMITYKGQNYAQKIIKM